MKMKSVIPALLLVGLFIAPLTAGQSPIVVVLSWDGMRHDYLDRATFPALSRVAREGVRARRLTPVFPSSTFPGHVSMATGTYPDRHGIVDNVFLDEERGRYAYSSDADWIEAEPLWIAAERQGIKAATYFWVGSESDWRGQGTSYRIAPFDGSRPEALKVDQILSWLALPEAARPQLIMSYWAGADSVGHNEGPNGSGVVGQIHDQDAQLNRLLAGLDELELWDRTTLIIVSDHGMAVATSYLDLGAALEEAGVDADVFGGAVAQIHLNDDSESDVVEQVLAELLADVPGSAFYRREDIPADFRMKRASRIGHWVAVVPPPYSFYKPSGMESVLVGVATLFGKEFGMHGYQPALSDMGGIFLAMGRGVPEGFTLDVVRQIDVAASIAELMGIEPPLDSEGVSIW